jgi:PAS domain S-box-containing protein
VSASAAAAGDLVITVQGGLALAAVALALFALRRMRRRFERADRRARELIAGLEGHLAQRTAELRASEERLRGTLDGMIEGCQIIDFDWRYRYLNPAAAAHGRRSVEDLVGRTMMEAYPGIEHTAVFAAIDRCRTERIAARMENEFTFPDGHRGWFQLSIEPVPEGVFVLSMDISERRAMEAQLRQAQKMEAVGQLSGGIAHDFNNILTVIGSNTELIARALPADAPAQADLREIDTAVRRGADMIAQLLRFSRRSMLQRQPMDPAAVIRNFSGVLRRLLPETVRLQFAGDDAPGTVLLDPGALEQIVVNLCTNARDAMPDGGAVRIECRPTWLDEGYHATHPWVAPGPYVCVAVADTGVGMDETIRSRIFEPFFTTKAAGAGSGLGMAMVYGLMKQHEGMVHVYSEPGGGTVVRLYFPLAAAAAPAAAAVRPPRPLPAPRAPSRSETVLVVEDEAAIRRASRRALEGEGYAALEAADGEEALEIFRRHGDRIALVIADLVMPRLGGRQLAEALRASGADVPILFTSGYAPGTAYHQGDLPPGVRFLHKPWTLADLLTAVRGLLDGSSQALRPSGG